MTNKHYMDSSKFCKDVDKYEDGLVAGIRGMKRLMDEGYLSWIACQDIWAEMLAGLYDKEE